MHFSNTTEDELNKALNEVNKKYEGNVTFNTFDKVGRRYHVTLKVLDSSMPGHRVGFSLTSKGNRRKLVSACWHVHGDFFDAILEINKNVVIRSAGRVIDINGGNWVDKNIGSIINPLLHSDACECPYPKPF